MAKVHSIDGVMTYEFSMDEFKMEIFHLSGRDMAQAHRNFLLFNDGLLGDLEERRRQARNQLAARCKGQCHGIPEMGDTQWMAESDQKKLGYLVLTGAALTLASPGRR